MESNISESNNYNTTNIYLFTLTSFRSSDIYNGNIRTVCEICSKLTTKTKNTVNDVSDVSIVDFEQVIAEWVVSLLLTLNWQMFARGMLTFSSVPFHRKHNYYMFHSNMISKFGNTVLYNMRIILSNF